MLGFASYDDDAELDLSFAKNSEKLDGKSLYTKLSALLCNPLMRLFNVLLWFIRTKGQQTN